MWTRANGLPGLWTFGREVRTLVAQASGIVVSENKERAVDQVPVPEGSFFTKSAVLAKCRP